MKQRQHRKEQLRPGRRRSHSGERMQRRLASFQSAAFQPSGSPVSVISGISLSTFALQDCQLPKIGYMHQLFPKRDGDMRPAVRVFVRASSVHKDAPLDEQFRSIPCLIDTGCTEDLIINDKDLFSKVVLLNRRGETDRVYKAVYDAHEVPSQCEVGRTLFDLHYTVSGDRSHSNKKN